MSDTLVLDVGYRPIEVMSWQVAIVKVLLDKTAAVVEEHPDRYINTVKWTIKMPSVIRLLKPVKRSRVVKFSRHNVFIRDNNVCQYCGHKFPRSAINIDHVLPRAQGGRTTWENVVCSCIDCNSRKGCRTPAQAQMRLLRAPVRPKKLADGGSFMSYRIGMPESWQTYLRNAIYWDAELEE